MHVSFARMNMQTVYFLHFVKKNPQFNFSSQKVIYSMQFFENNLEKLNQDMKSTFSYNLENVFSAMLVEEFRHNTNKLKYAGSKG